MKTRSTRDVWKKLSAMDFFRSTMIVLLLFLVASAISAWSRLTWGESLTLVMTPAMILVLVLGLTRIRLQKNMRGIVLLDAGENPQRGLYTVIATTSLVGGGMGGIAMLFESQRTLHSLHFVLFSLVPGTVFLIKALGRAEFCQNGIWAYTALIPWSSIEAYQWKSSDEWKQSALWISCKNRLESPAVVKLDIPESEKENVESLLKQYAPSATALHKQLLRSIDDGSALHCGVKQK